MATLTTVEAARITPEEFEEGAAFQTLGRTVTEADVVNFACLSGDLNPHHVNREWMRESPFGDRIAHGLLITSLAVGGVPQRLKRRARMRQASALFKRPVQMGDTIRIEGRALRDRAVAGDLPSPVELRVVNQRDQLCAKIKLSYEDGPEHVPPFDGELRDSLELTPREIADGIAYRTPARTMTEAQVVGFAALTGDWSPTNADAEWARTHGEGERTVQEMLQISTAAALVPLDVPRLIAARRSDISWHRPVLLGETLRIEGRFAEGLPAGDGAQQEIYHFRMVNQRGELCVSMHLNLVMQELDA
jgi:3-hydroxybutyryl-CoA dehydratase